MSRALRVLVSLSLIGVAAGAVAACGSSEDRASTTAAPKAGGAIVASTTSAPDYLDPALAGSLVAWQALWNVYTPLLTYPHRPGTEGGELVPGLAEALPEVSSDGKTYKLKLREGLKYSDGKALKASDFEHTVKRILKLNSIGLSFYTVIDGTEKYMKGGKARADISGIETDDATGEITIRLTAPSATFSNVLAMDYAGIVPGDTPFSNQTSSPPPGVGPYKIDKLDSKRSFDLVKVDGFAIEGRDAGKLDKITIRTIKNRRRATEDTIGNKVDVMLDPPAPDQIAEVREQFGGVRYRQFPINSVSYFFLNEKIAPFKDRRVRQAVNHAVDRRAISRLYGGLLEPNCNFLPQLVKGFAKIDPCPYEPPDIDKAKALVEQAGAGGATVNIFGTDEPETKAIVDYVADVMSQAGLKARPRILEGSVYYDVVGNSKTNAHAGFIAYNQDYPHPATFMFLVDGRSISDTGNPNMGNIDDAQINKIIDRAGKSTSLDAVADDYAAIDRRLVEEGHIIPLGSRQLSAFVSDKVDFDNCIVWHPVYNLDYTQLCLR